MLLAKYEKAIAEAKEAREAEIAELKALLECLDYACHPIHGCAPINEAVTFDDLEKLVAEYGFDKEDKTITEISRGADGEKAEKLNQLAKKLLDRFDLLRLKWAKKVGIKNAASALNDAIMQVNPSKSGGEITKFINNSMLKSYNEVMKDNMQGATVGKGSKGEDSAKNIKDNATTTSLNKAANKSDPQGESIIDTVKDNNCPDPSDVAHKSALKKERELQCRDAEMDAEECDKNDKKFREKKLLAMTLRKLQKGDDFERGSEFFKDIAKKWYDWDKEHGTVAYNKANNAYLDADNKEISPTEAEKGCDYYRLMKVAGTSLKDVLQKRMQGLVESELDYLGLYVKESLKEIENR